MTIQIKVIKLGTEYFRGFNGITMEFGTDILGAKKYDDDQKQNDDLNLLNTDNQLGAQAVLATLNITETNL